MRLRERVNVMLDYAAGDGLRSLQGEKSPAPARAVIPRAGRVGKRHADRRVILTTSCRSHASPSAPLGPFRVYQNDRSRGPWVNRQAKAIFQYLVAQPSPTGTQGDTNAPALARRQH
jgi:hypothetical protein